MVDFDPQTRIRFGGLVMAKSVKYLGKLAYKQADQVYEGEEEERMGGSSSSGSGCLLLKW